MNPYLDLPTRGERIAFREAQDTARAEAASRGALLEWTLAHDTFDWPNKKVIQMSAKPSELRAALQIDRHSLDMELVRQPELFDNAGNLLALANAERDTAKEHLSQVDARLYFDCRRELERSDGKASEGAIKAAIEIHEDHVEATKEYLDAKEFAERMATLKESFSMRSYMLKDLAGLYVANYYQTDNVKGGRADQYRSARNMDRLIEGRRNRRRVRLDD